MICTENRSSFFFTPWIGWPFGGRDRHRLEAGRKSFDARRGCGGRSRRATRATPTRERSGPSRPPRAVDAMAAGALRAEHLLAVLGVAARRIGRRRRGERAQVGQDLPDLVVVACADRAGISVSGTPLRSCGTGPRRSGPRPRPASGRARGRRGRPCRGSRRSGCGSRPCRRGCARRRPRTDSWPVWPVRPVRSARPAGP